MPYCLLILRGQLLAELFQVAEGALGDERHDPGLLSEGGKGRGTETRRVSTLGAGKRGERA